MPWFLVMVWLLILPSQGIAEGSKQARGMPPAMVLNPAADLWRDVRQRDMPASGTTQVRGVDAGVLINANGDKWRNLRMEQLIPIGGYLLLGIIVALTLFYLLRGRVKIVGGASQSKLPRYTSYERLIHWSMASIFLFLAITGLIILFGRPLLIPLLGKETFSILASVSKDGHNLVGPLFMVALILVFIKFVRRNIYQKGDLSWLLRGGGIIGKKHVPSNFFNMGEKSMFWMLIIVGLVIVASGLILLFPLFGQSREWMALIHLGHAIGAILMIGVILGHIYIGSIGMEGAIDGMKTGYCDLNWAREHHDLWAKQMENRGEAIANDAVNQISDPDTNRSFGRELGEAGK